METEPKPYSLEQAQEEARQLKEKVEEGTAETYDEAERKLQEEQSQSRVEERKKADQEELQKLRERISESSTESEPEIEGYYLKGLFDTGRNLVNTLASTEVVNQQSLDRLASGIINLGKLAEQTTVKPQELEAALSVIASGIQEITNNRGRAFDRNDLDVVLHSIRLFRQFAENIGGFSNQIQGIESVKNTSSLELLASIAKYAQGKSYGFSSLADAMADYLS